MEQFPYFFVVRDDVDLLVESIVEFLERRLRERLIVESPKPIGLATGRTMEPIYSRLVDKLKSWPTSDLQALVNGWKSFNLDEYIGLPIGDSRSFFNFMSNHIGKPLKLSADKLRIPNGHALNLQDEAKNYSNEIIKCGGISIQLLGLGVNGHIGFNEPPCSYDSLCRVVELSSSTRKQNAFSFGKNDNLVPSRAITLGLKEILSAQEIHLVVTGPSKANVLQALMNSPSTEKIPASWLRSHDRVFIWADKQAYRKI